MTEAASVDTAYVADLLDRRRLRDGEANDAQIGQHETRCQVEFLGPAFPPCGDRLSYSQVGAPQVADLLDPAPRIGRVAGTAWLGEQVGHRHVKPLATSGRLDLGRLPLGELQEIRDVGRGVAELARGERTLEPIGESIRLGQPDLQLAFE